MKKILISSIIFILLIVIGFGIFWSQQQSKEQVQEIIETTQDTITNRLSRPDPLTVPVSIQKVIELNTRRINDAYDVLTVSRNAYQSNQELKQFVNPFIPNFLESNQPFADILFDRNSNSYVTMDEIVTQLNIVQENNTTYWVFIQSNVIYKSEVRFRNITRLSVDSVIYGLPSYKLNQIDVQEDTVFVYMDYGLTERIPAIITIESLNQAITDITILTQIPSLYSAVSDELILNARAEAFLYNEDEYYTELTYSFEQVNDTHWLVVARGYVDVIFVVQIGDVSTVNEVSISEDYHKSSSIVMKCFDDECWIGNLITGNFTLCLFETANCEIKRTITRKETVTDIELSALSLLTNRKTDNVLYLKDGKLMYQDIRVNEPFLK